MHKDTFILTEGDDADDLAGSNVVSFNRPSKSERIPPGSLSLSAGKQLPLLLPG